MLWKAISRTAESNNQHDPRPLPPRLRQPNQQHTNNQRTRLKPTTKTQTTPKTTICCSSSFNQLIVELPQHQSNHSKDTRPRKAATRNSHDTLILSETQLFPSTDGSPLYLKRQEIWRRRPKHSGPQGKSALCCRELIVRVIIVVVIVIFFERLSVFVTGDWCFALVDGVCSELVKTTYATTACSSWYARLFQFLTGDSSVVSLVVFRKLCFLHLHMALGTYR